MARRARRARTRAVRLGPAARLAVAAALAALAAAAFLRRPRAAPSAPAARRADWPPAEGPGETVELLVTGYCNCGQCCGWRPRWFFFGAPVYNYGRMKGRPKKVGVTAAGTTARTGTVAADPAVYPFGTRLDIPGYGAAVVEDTGGAIKGGHVDAWFPTHDAARAWGARRVPVTVYRAKRAGAESGKD